MRKSSPAEKAACLWSRWDLLLYSVLAFFAFGPRLFLNQSYFDNDLLAQFGPWRAFLKSQLSQGHFPLWNPYLMGGEPFLANLQNMMFYPFNYLTLPFSVPTGFTVFFLLHFFWAAFGMHLWLRSLGLSPAASRVGALLFASSNFFWLELIHPPVLAAFAWLPWFFFGLERLAKNRTPLAGFGNGLAFALLFLGGSFQVTLGALYGGAAYFLFRLFQTGRWNGKIFLRPALLLLWGALPLAAQLIPTLEFSALCGRRAEPQAQGVFVNQLSLPPAKLHQLLFPRFTLPADQPMAVAAQSTDSKENQWASLGYLGLWAPFLALGAFGRRDKKILFFLGALLLVGLALALGSNLPLLPILRKILPGVDQVRVPFRYLYLYVLGLSALAAAGYEAWSSQGRGWLKAALPYGFLLTAAALWHPGRNWREITALALGLGGLWLCARSRTFKNQGAFLFQAALILPLFLNGLDEFHPGPSSNFNFIENSTPLTQIGKEIRPNRVLFGSPLYYPIQVDGKKYAVNFPQNAACVLRLKNFGGYNPLTLQTKEDLASLPLETIVKLGAIRGFIAQDPGLKIPGFQAAPALPYTLYQWQRPLAYVFAPFHLEVLADRTQRLERLGAPTFDPAESVLLNEPLPAREVTLPIRALLRYHLELDNPDIQTFTVELNRPGLVVFTDTMFPGWKALVDDKPTPVHTADHFLRSIYLTGGTHRVEFRFQPAWLRPILLGLLAWTLLTFLGLLLVSRQALLASLKQIAKAAGGSGLGRVKPIRVVYDAVFRLLKPRSVTVQGHRMWLDDKDTLELATNEVYEPLETALFQRELKPGQVVLDIGANIGYYTLIAARQVGPKGRVYAFEPDPVNFQLLRKNVEANGYGNVILVNKAVADKTKATRLYLNETNKGDHRLYDSGDGRRSIAVEVVALDHFFKQLDKKVHFIKMDIQGAEGAALEGMKNLIRKNRGLKLVMEFEPANLRRFGSAPLKVLKTLKKAGFKLWDISEKDGKVRPVTADSLLNRYTVANGEYTNLYCIKK